MGNDWKLKSLLVQQLSSDPHPPPHTHPNFWHWISAFLIEWRVENKRDPLLPPSPRAPKEESSSAGPGWPGTGPVPPVTARQLDTTAAKNARNVGGCVLPAPLPPPSSQNRIFPIQGNPVPLWENRGVAGRTASHCICTDKLGWAPRVGVSSTDARAVGICVGLLCARCFIS